MTLLRYKIKTEKQLQLSTQKHEKYRHDQIDQITQEVLVDHLAELDDQVDDDEIVDDDEGEAVEVDDDEAEEVDDVLDDNVQGELENLSDEHDLAQ